MGNEAEATSDRLSAISTLGEPTRRALYEHVVAVGDWVSRDEAADAVGLERATAAHHLDRLSADGLLDVEYRRLSGRQGPGAGRPAKLYRRARRDFDIALPPRDYALAGRLLAEAIDRSLSEGMDIAQALEEVATAEGRKLAEDVTSHVRGRDKSRPDKKRDGVLDALEAHGFEPQVATDGTVILRNCPFHQLAQKHTDLICGMNLCLLKTAIEDVGQTGLEARLEPEADQCCVKLHATR